jgi:hypothetical protein
LIDWNSACFQSDGGAISAIEVHCSSCQNLQLGWENRVVSNGRCVALAAVRPVVRFAVGRAIKVTFQAKRTHYLTITISNSNYTAKGGSKERKQ